ncbi:MAG: hypothetical protein RXR41_03140 [Candidatus Marsarchaeota archaeon]
MNVNKGSDYPWASYGLAWNPKKGLGSSQYALYATQTAVIVVLSYLSVVLLGPLSYSGISLFYFVYPFFMVFSMWWGLWGMIAAYVGCVIGAGLMVGLGVVPSLAYSVADLVPPLAAFVIYRGVLSKRGIDPLFRDLVEREISGYKTNRAAAWFWFILINGVIFNFVSAELGVGIQYAMGLVPPSAFWLWWWGWAIGDLAALVLITPVIVKGLSGLVERAGLINLGRISRRCCG